MKHVILIIFLGLPFSASRATAAEVLPTIDDKPKNAEGRPIEDDGQKVLAIETQSRSENIYPSNWGEAGIFRVRSAESLPDGTLTFGIGGEFYAVSDAPNLGTGSSANTLAENIFLGYAPLKNWTLAVMRRSSSTTFGDPAQLISSLGDFNFSTSYSFPIDSSFALAPILNILLASNFNNLAPAGNTVSGGLGVAGTYSFYKNFALPLFVHANLLYHMPQIRGSAPTGIAPETYFNFSRYNTVTLGLAAEYKFGDVIPFLEFYDTVQTDAPISFASSPSKISFGARMTPLSNKSLAVLVGADIGLGKAVAVGVPFSPDYQIIGQLSYTVGLTQTERKHYYTTSEVNVVDRKFEVKRNINFKVGKAELEQDSTKVLDEVAKVVQKNHVKKLLIVGHTDSTHTEEYNLKLSQDRANTVKRYLSQNGGIPEDTMIAQGYGKRKPIASNSTEEGRSTNRRVEFFILE